MMPSGHDYNAIQAYLARSLQLNLMEEMPPAPYPARDKKILHLGYVFPKTFLNLNLWKRNIDIIWIPRLALFNTDSISKLNY